MKPTLRAIISDQKLHGSKMATVYGSSSDNDTIRIFKQVGYGISIFFLLLTLAIYFVIKEVRTVSSHMKNEVKVQNLKKKSFVCLQNIQCGLQLLNVWQFYVLYIQIQKDYFLLFRTFDKYNPFKHNFNILALQEIVNGRFFVKIPNTFKTSF